MKTPPTWGDRLKVTHKLIRKSKVETVQGKGSFYPKKQIKTFWEAQTIQSCECMVIGKRTLTDGRKWHEDGFTNYMRETHFTAYLVTPVRKMNAKPFYIRHEGL
jgi:hypothetical protein